MEGKDTAGAPSPDLETPDLQKLTRQARVGSWSGLFIKLGEASILNTLASSVAEAYTWGQCQFLSPFSRLKLTTRKILLIFLRFRRSHLLRPSADQRLQGVAIPIPYMIHDYFQQSEGLISVELGCTKSMCQEKKSPVERGVRSELDYVGNEDEDSDVDSGGTIRVLIESSSESSHGVS